MDGDDKGQGQQTTMHALRTMDGVSKNRAVPPVTTSGKARLSTSSAFATNMQDVKVGRWQAAIRMRRISGSSTILRHSIQQVVRNAQRGLFAAVIAEALDRISRDQADVATLYKHLKFAGVTIVTLAEGEISELHVGLKGTMNALFLKDLAMKTHRGLRGRVEKGKAGDGLCYGYCVLKQFDGNGEPIRGDRGQSEAWKGSVQASALSVPLSGEDR